MRILQSRVFKNATKRLYPNQKKALDDAVGARLAFPVVQTLKISIFLYTYQ